jgi:hypothetical protein
MRNISAEFLTVLPTYLEPRAFASDNAWPLHVLGHWLGFSFLMTPSSSMQANMCGGRMPCVARHESSWISSSLSCDARPGSTRQIKERQGWVDRAEPRRFLVSFDVESDSYAAAARECLTSVAAVPEIEPRLGTLEEVGATDEAGYLVVEADDFEELRHPAD